MFFPFLNGFNGFQNPDSTLFRRPFGCLATQEASAMRVFRKQTRKKGLPTEKRKSFWRNWHAHGESNPGYRRERA
ncbi:hypothetical protein, partial [Neisseria bacilliformis]|uniref:hypothetical protein n=1 Tax=Neisseria bacilliformis TaxID=267212 RepID=UPI0028E1BDEA